MSFCGTCKKTFGSTGDVIICSGFCNGFFHNEKTCTGVDKNVAMSSKRCNNIMYFCDPCAALVKNNVLKTILSTGDTTPKLASNLDKLSEEIAANRKLIQELSVHVGKSAPLQNQNIAWRTIETPTTSKKRKVTDDSEIDNIPLKPAPSNVVQGTKTMSISVKIIQPKLWLHVSEFDTNETPEAVKELISICLGIKSEDVEAFKLIPRNREIDSLRFICFKVGISINFKEKKH